MRCVTHSALVSGLFAVSACSQQGSDDLVAFVPVLEACEADVVQRIEEIPDSSPYSARVRPFDGQLRGQPYLVGLVEVRSAARQVGELERRAAASGIAAEDHLASLARGLIQDCNMNQMMEFRKSDPAAIERARQVLEGLGQGSFFTLEADGTRVYADSQPVYLVDDGENLEIYYNQQSDD